MSAAPRIASLVPSGTDIVAAMGLGRQLVGVSHECDHPVAEGRPVLTSSTLSDGPSAPRSPGEIDRCVTEAAEAGQSLYRTDEALLAELRPDVVLAQSVCDVCAVAPEQATAAVPSNATLVMLEATTLAGLERDLATVGEALGEPERGQQQIRAIRSAHRQLAERVAGLERPRVLALEWSDPPFVGGHWVPELVQVAGGEHVLAGPGDPSRRTTWEEVADVDPDLILFVPCGYGVESAAAEARGLLDHPEAAKLRAVREGRLWAADARRLFSRCTPAVVTAAPLVASMCHPGRLPPVPPRRAVRVTPPVP